MSALFCLLIYHFIQSHLFSSCLDPSILLDSFFCLNCPPPHIFTSLRISLFSPLDSCHLILPALLFHLVVLFNTSLNVFLFVLLVLFSSDLTVFSLLFISTVLLFVSSLYFTFPPQLFPLLMSSHLISAFSVNVQSVCFSLVFSLLLSFVFGLDFSSFLFSFHLSCSPVISSFHISAFHSFLFSSPLHLPFL